MSKIGRICFDIVVGAGALACVLAWLEVKPKDVRMMAWPHWLWLIGALILFAINLGSSLRSLYLSMVADKRVSAKIASINQANAEQIARINKQHESDEYRIRQARDEITAELRAAKEKYLAENIEKTNCQKELATAQSRVRELQSELPPLRLTDAVTKIPSAVQMEILEVANDLELFGKNFEQAPEIRDRPEAEYAGWMVEKDQWSRKLDHAYSDKFSERITKMSHKLGARGLEVEGLIPANMRSLETLRGVVVTLQNLFWQVAL
jgi:chromosome segregation ATPase